MEQKDKYATMNKDEFKKLILMEKSKSTSEWVFFILNTLHNIVDSANYYCY